MYNYNVNKEYNLKIEYNKFIYNYDDDNTIIKFIKDLNKTNINNNMKYCKDYIDEINEENSYDKIICKNNKYYIGNVIIKNNRAINNDIVYYNYNEVINIKERSNENIVGVLLINDSKKYGFNKKNNPYYLFKPLNHNYPNFLVSSNNKSKSNIYVCIKFLRWDVSDIYPIGNIIDNIGCIKEYENQIRCYLYKNNLIYKKLKINKKEEKILNNYDYKAFTIDPCNCKDIDDSISFKTYIKNDLKYNEVGVHITDVSDYINNIDNIKELLTSSIYYGNKQINMIPNNYAEDICSLLENNIKKCVSVIFTFDNNHKIINYDIKLSNVYIIKNFSYDEAELYIKSNNNKYNDLIELWNFMKIYDNTIIDTHILIEKLMILCNKTIGEVLYNYDKKNTILRIQEKKKNEEINVIDNILNMYLDKKKFNTAIYSFNNDYTEHYDLNLKYYTHFTSPIRRYIDIINHINIKKYLENDKLIDINDDIINHININNKNIKRFNNDYKIIEIKKNDINETDYLDAYIIKININYLLLYIVDLNLEYKYELYNNKYNNIYSIYNITNKYIEIHDYNEKYIRFEKYKKIKVKISICDNNYDLLNNIKVIIV